MHRRHGWVQGMHSLRDDLIGVLTDEDLEFSPGGSNPTLGRLLDELGRIESAYGDSIRTLEFEIEPGDGSRSLTELRGWFADLDTSFNEALENWSEHDESVSVSRDGFLVSRDDQVEIYLQAVLIVLAKIVVYVRAMGREVPESAEAWIG